VARHGENTKSEGCLRLSEILASNSRALGLETPCLLATSLGSEPETNSNSTYLKWSLVASGSIDLGTPDRSASLFRGAGHGTPRSADSQFIHLNIGLHSD